MKQERLGNIATFINGAAFKPEDWNNNGLRIIRIQNLTNPAKLYNRTLRKVDEKYIVKKGDVLVSWSATIDVFTWEDNEDALLNQHIFKVVFDFSKVEKRYFIFALKQTINELTKFAHGSTMKHVVKKDFDNHKILLPPLPDQIKIAEILTQAEKLITQRKESIILLDELLKSIFVKKFINKKYPLVKLQDITSKITDGEHAKPTYLEAGMPFISVKNISKGSLDFTDCKFVSNDDHIKFNKRCNPEFEDIIYTKVGATYGRAVVVNTTEPFSLYVSVALIKPDKTKINPYFLNAAINHPFVKRQADKSIKGTGVPDLHLIEIKSFKIPFPPLEKQIEFATIVEKIEGLRKEYDASLKELENMYGVLSQKAFNGELLNENLMISEANVDYIEWGNEIKETQTAVVGSIELPKEVENQPVFPEKDTHIKDMSLDEYYGIPEDIIAKYGSIEDHHQDWEFLLKKFFHDSPVDISRLEDIYHKLFYQRGHDFEFEDWKDFIFKELSKSKSFLKQKFNPETNQLELLINEIKKS